jgi:hypothetical protein
MNIFFSDDKSKTSNLKHHIKNKNTKKKGKFSKQIKRYNDRSSSKYRKTKKLNNRRYSTRRKRFIGGGNIDNMIPEIMYHQNTIHDSLLFDIENNLIFNSYKNHPGYRTVKRELHNILINDEKIVEFFSISIISLLKSLYVHTSRSVNISFHGGGSINSVGEALINPEHKVHTRFGSHIKEVILHLLFLVMSCLAFYHIRDTLEYNINNDVIHEQGHRFDMKTYLQDAVNFDWQNQDEVSIDFYDRYVKSDSITLSQYMNVNDVMQNIFDNSKIRNSIESLNFGFDDQYEIQINNDFKKIDKYFKNEYERNRFRRFTGLFVPDLFTITYDNIVNARTNHIKKLEDYTLDTVRNKSFNRESKINENMKQALHHVYDFVTMTYFLAVGSFASLTRLTYMVTQLVRSNNRRAASTINNQIRPKSIDPLRQVTLHNQSTKNAAAEAKPTRRPLITKADLDSQISNSQTSDYVKKRVEKLKRLT